MRKKIAKLTVTSMMQETKTEVKKGNLIKFQTRKHAEIREMNEKNVPPEVPVSNGDKYFLPNARQCQWLTTLANFFLPFNFLLQNVLCLAIAISSTRIAYR